jgi:hypothetical protein
MTKVMIQTRLADRHREYARYARSQAPAWERTVMEALPTGSLSLTTSRQADPAIHKVPRQSLGTTFAAQQRSMQMTFATFCRHRWKVFFHTVHLNQFLGLCWTAQKQLFKRERLPR